MFNRRRVPPPAPPQADPRLPGKAPAFRRSLALFTFLSTAPLALGVLIALPPARLEEGFRKLLDLRSHVLAGAGWTAAPAPPAAPAPAPPAAPAAPAAAALPDRAVLAFGDRLKVTFYESLGVALGERRGQADQAIATIFPRMDLSADYVVDEDGALSIPRLGRFQAAGETASAVQAAMAEAFRQAFGRSSDVHVGIVERLPVRVLGAVRNAGAFRYQPGMTVLQALADAGGGNAAIADTSGAIEAIRETQRLRQAEARLDRQLVNQARLRALREGADAIAVPQAIAARLAADPPGGGLQALVAGARATLAIERAHYQQQLALADRQVGIARVEVEAQTMRATQLNVLLAKKSERLRELEGIAARGSVAQFKLTDVGADVSEVSARREDLRVAVAQSGRRLVEAEIALARIQLDHTAGIDRELTAIQQEIEDSREAIASMRAVARVLHGGAHAGAPEGIPVFRLTRRLADGFKVMVVADDAMLQPGDVVQVGTAGGAEPLADGVIADTTQLQK